MSKYTKGPWQVTPDKIRVQTGEDVEDYQIADCEDTHFCPPYEQCLANACLIASAPELLEACKQAKWLYDELALSSLAAASKYGPDYEPPTDKQCLEIREMLEQAIKKAEVF